MPSCTLFDYLEDTLYIPNVIEVNYKLISIIIKKFWKKTEKNHCQYFIHKTIFFLHLQTLEKLPDSLKNRFYIYLNILPVVVNICQYGLLVGGITMLLFAIARVTMRLSHNIQPSHKVSKHRKYSSIYPDMIQRLGDVEKVFELSEKSKKNSVSRADLLHDAESCCEKKFMLEEEPAISGSEDEELEVDSKQKCENNTSEVG